MKLTISLILFGLRLLAGPRASPLWAAKAFSLSSPTTQISRRKTSARPLPSSSSSAASTSSRRSSSSNSRLFMSDIPEDNDKHRNKQRSPPPSTNNDKENDDTSQDFISSWAAFLKPPPKPEDQLVMMGDIFSLFVYSITDHLLCQSLSHYTLWQASHDPQKLHSLAQSLAEMSPQTAAVFSTPVWLEDVTSANSPAVLHVLHDQIASQLVTHYYSPLLEPAGMATCVLAGTWLLAGWWNRAFLFRNTLNCPTSQALIVTGQTWIITTIILLLATMLSSTITANDVMGGGGGGDAIIWTRGDLDFIFGSLSVVALWRFLFSSILGGGGGGTTDSSNDNSRDAKKGKGRK